MSVNIFFVKIFNKILSGIPGEKIFAEFSYPLNAKKS
jgi:hypothetical protein